ncbi:MAG: flagellar basal body-associated FliL family protein [Litoreibacter sp.]
MKKILPILLLLIGLGAGGAAGFILRPEPEPLTEEQILELEETAEDIQTDNQSSSIYIKLKNQFIVPVVSGDRVASLVVLSISLEMPPGTDDQVLAKEPKLRDEFLRVLFDHAYAGGFEGQFTASPKLDTLSSHLLKVARKITTDLVSDVLITEIIRQDN